MIGLADERIAAAEARLRSGPGTPDVKGRIDRAHALVGETRNLNRHRRYHARSLRKAREAQELVLAG